MHPEEERPWVLITSYEFEDIFCLISFPMYYLPKVRVTYKKQEVMDSFACLD